MAEFPRLRLNPQTSPDIAAANHSADVPSAFREIAGATGQLAETLTGMAAEAAKRDGEAAAARDAAAGAVTPRDDGTIRGEAYDQVADQVLSSHRKAAMHEAMGKAFAENPDDPAALEKALQAARGGLGLTGRGLVDAEVSSFYDTQRADLMARAHAGAIASLKQAGQASLLQDLDTEGNALDQVAAGAPLDGNGAARVAAAATGLVRSLAKYGPKGAFSVGGVDFGPDPTRMGAVGPDDLQRLVQARIGAARQTQVLAVADQLPTPTAKKLFAGEVETRWKAGDPAFAGIDGREMEQLQRRIEAGADRLDAQQRGDRIEAAQRAKGEIDAFRWGGDADFDAALADARASGDAGLVAEVQFYRDADPATRGVLHTAAARQLGLLGGPEDPSAPVVVDAEGRPVAGSGGDRGGRNNNPGNLTELPGGKLWPGQVGVDREGRDGKPGFAVFANPAAGAAAAKANLRAYGREGLDTVAAIVARWAPKGDGANDPAAYANTVAGKLGVKATDKLNMNDAAVIDHLAAAIFGVETPGGTWATPPGVQPGTPAFVAWAATREGFPSDPLGYALGGKNRPAIAQVSTLVPDAAFADGGPHQAWAASLAQRAKLGQALARTYGVPPRMLTNGEREYYKSAIAEDPQRAIALASAAAGAIGPAQAVAMMRELGDAPDDAQVHVHLADLAASGGLVFAKAAAQGLALKAQGAKLDEAAGSNEAPGAKELRAAFEDYRGVVPAPVLTAAQAVAMAARLSDQQQGVAHVASYYAKAALGATSRNGRTYGGPTSLNGADTVAPWWLDADRLDDALGALGKLWAANGRGPRWSDGTALTAHHVAGLRMHLTEAGRYRLTTRNGLMVTGPGGEPFEFDIDAWRPALAGRLPAGAVRPDRF